MAKFNIEVELDWLGEDGDLDVAYRKACKEIRR